MQDFEKLGLFYLGKRVDADTRKTTDDLVLYDSKDLVTHALCVGMTGSGKTGLGVAVIEEAAIDGVPVLVIDPKGDLTNLLLTFPQLRADDFQPWVNEDDARRAGQSMAEFAADQAARWKKGLGEWGEDGARIQRLRDAADFAIYTPGSTAGLQVSALTSFVKPPIDEPELLRAHAHTAVSSLLALAGIDGEPLKSPEHILLSTILLAAWQAGDAVDVPMLIQRIQQPPFARVGVMDIDTFFPAKARLAFATSLNALIASPGFEVWSEGAPLDVAAFLRTPAGKPRVSIFSIAHLDDGQRMFFVSLLLNAVASWMRAQSGTSSLRALVYMDEIFGFFPPVANPPSKAPLLTLLKQGRAAGVGVVLATQNPVDLDYKGLSNIGTWWLGRLQTDRDKARVLDGLEGASDSAFDRAEADRLLSSLTSRVFLMRNVHEDTLTLFQSRWALSYLRGPLGRSEIKALSAARPTAAASAAAPPAVRSASAVAATARPLVPPDVPQFFSPEAAAAVSLPLRPVVYGAVAARFVEPKYGLDATKLLTLAAPITDGAVTVDWTQAERVDWTPDTLEKDAPEAAAFGSLPAAALKAKNYDAWTKQLLATLVGAEALTLQKSPSTELVSLPDELERDFRARIAQASRESRDEQLDAIKKKYASKQVTLEERLRKAAQAKQREAEQATGQKLQTVISVGATLVGALFGGGRKGITVGSLGRATTAARGFGRAMKESQDVDRAEETVEALQRQKDDLDAQIKAEVDAIAASQDAATERFLPIVVKPKKTNLNVTLVALVWTK